MRAGTEAMQQIQQLPLEIATEATTCFELRGLFVEPKFDFLEVGYPLFYRQFIHAGPYKLFVFLG